MAVMVASGCGNRPGPELPADPTPAVIDAAIAHDAAPDAAPDAGVDAAPPVDGGLPTQRRHPAVIDRRPASGGTAISLDQGSDDGLAVGDRGRLIQRDGTPVRGGDVIIEQVLPTRARALVTLPIERVDPSFLVEVRP